MSRIERRFEALRGAGRKAVVPFLTAGDPDPGQTVALMHALVRGGADLIELGVPFSDPMADGPVIQRASERALRHGTRLRDVLEMVRAFRRDDPDTPVVLMGYLNPIEAMGYRRFADEAVAAGVDGALTVDLPPEEAGELLEALGDRGMDPIFLIAPTTGPARMDVICGAARGFVYYVALKGVTGAANLDYDAVAEKVAEVRHHTGLPVGVGFGIKDADSARRMAAAADAVIVGSAIVSRIEQYGDDPAALERELEGFTATLRQAVDGAAATAGTG